MSGYILPPSGAASPRAKHRDVVFLFDVDGTVTRPRQNITQEVLDYLLELKKSVVVAFVGGSDYSKILEQMGGPEVIRRFHYIFTENGLVTHRHGEVISDESLLTFLGEEKYQKYINFCLKYLSELNIPQKRGTFIELRKGMVNISPIGRNCSQEERDAFEQYDKEYNVRRTFIKTLMEKFPDYGLVYAIGGQISFDVYPRGWDKTYSLNFLIKDGFRIIHFFGDKTEKGGNDHEIFMDERTVGHTVTGPEDMLLQVEAALSTLD